MPENRASQLRRQLQYGEFGDPNNPIDEASLSDQELQSRLQGFQELGQTKGEVDPAGLQRQIVSKLNSFGINNNQDAIAQRISDLTRQLGHYPSAQELTDKFGYDATGGEQYTETGRKLKASVPQDLQNFFNDQGIRNDLSGQISGQINAPDVGGDIKRLQDITSERGRVAKGNQDIQSFLGELPKTLADQTGQFLDTQKTNAETNLRDFLDPQIRQSLAARGLLTSGDLSAELANAGENLQGGLNQQKADLQSQDAAFFENAAYQVNLKKSLDANQNLSQEINFQRGNALNAQENRFQTSQQQQQDSFGMDAFRRQQEQNLTAQNQRLRQQQDIANNQRRASTIGQIGQYGGMLAGAALGGPVGAAAGGAAGGIFSNLFTDASLRKSG